MATGTLPAHRIRCATCRGAHATVAEVRQCADDAAYWQERCREDAAIERAHELWLETRFSDVIRWEEEQERLRIGF